MSELSAFPGRVIFDHMPKTAGQAMNAWLQSALGTGCVTTNLIGNHRELIKRFGGEYSVISGHVAFFGEGLDPRYQYATCLREPIDRAVSWLFFVLKNHEAGGLQNVWHETMQFLETEGEASVPSLDHIRNPYVEHFAAIDAPPASSEEEKLAKALAAIERYAVWGIYEALPDFLADFAGLLGLPAPKKIARVNVTRERPAVDRISAKLRKRLEELNALDIEFYRILRGRYEQARQHWQRPAVAVSRWMPFERPAERVFSAPEFALLSATLEGGGNRVGGSLLSIALEFSLAAEVAELEIGIHVFDEDGRWAFGTNTTLLGQVLTRVAAGTHRLRYAFVADLPEGEYTAGFAFAERGAESTREFAWYDKLLSFRVTLQRATPSVGYVSLPTAVDCHRLSDRIIRPVMDAQGTLHCEAVLGDLAVGEVLSLPVVLLNDSAQDWVSLWAHPINLSYRWLDDKGNVVVPDGERTPLPNGALRAGESAAAALAVQAPEFPGRYRLCALPVQESLCWFDERGFAPLEIEVAVVAADGARHFPARDVRLCSQGGHIEGESRVSNGEAGYLLFGPYVKIPAGAWRVVLSGRFDPQRGLIRADVAAGKGAQVFAECEVENACDSLWLEFELNVAVDDLEVRIWVDKEARARIDALHIEPVAEDSAVDEPPAPAGKPAGAQLAPLPLRGVKSAPRQKGVASGKRKRKK